MTREVVYRKEADVKKVVKKLLDQHGWFWWMPPMNGFGQTGISDFNALKNGVFMGCETKFGKNAPTAMQKAFLQSITQEDAIAFCVSERNIEHFEAWLGAFDRATIAQSKGEDVAPEDGAMMLNAMAELQSAFL
jgi:hypothetical protein